MKKEIFKLSAVLLSVLVIAFTAYGESNQWEGVKNEGGIEISLRSVPGSAIKEFRAVTSVQGRISSILALLEDYGSYTKWMHRCTEAKLLLKKNQFERVVYTVTSSPWPVEDRDIAVKSVVSQNKKTGAVTISLVGLPGYIPVRSGKVRVVRVKGFWLFEPVGKDRVRITYRLHSEPGGSLPESLVNKSLVEIPYNTLYNMKKMISMSPYKDAK